MHTFRESASVSENVSWRPNRDYRYHPPHNPIHGLNRRIIPLRFALLPYLHKGGSLSQRPRSLSLSFSRVRIGVHVHASIENTPWGPSIPRPSLEWFRFRSPRAHHRGMTFKHWKAVDGRSFGESCKLFYGIRGYPCHSRCATPLKPILVVRFFPARPPMTSEDGCLLAS